MTKFATFAAALGLTASSALAGGYVAPVVDVEPVVVEEKPPAVLLVSPGMVYNDRKTAVRLSTQGMKFEGGKKAITADAERRDATLRADLHQVRQEQ